MEITPAVIDRIDSLRYESPSAAHQLALDALSASQIPPEIAPGIFGALGSVLRMQDDFIGAERSIQWGLHLVKDDLFTEGRLYQRLSSVRGNRFDFANATQFSKKAAACFELTGADHWKTTTIFDQGRLLCESDRWEEGLDLLQEAHERFGPEAAEPWIGSTLGQTALAYDGVGRPEEGLVWLKRAKGYELSPWLAIRQTWTEARLRTSVEDFAQARELFRQIIDFFDGVNHIELALAQVELAQCELLSGNAEESRAMLHDLRRSIPFLAIRV